VSVHDSGPGVDAADAERIFEDGVSSKQHPGERVRGLGLALVRQVVLRHGGDVSVSNNGGAVFTVRLPITMGQDMQSAITAASA
jgi:two-component system CitB family sensor kinase